MLDLPGVPGKMFEWKSIQIVEGAEDVLRHITNRSAIYIASGAINSTEQDI